MAETNRGRDGQAAGDAHRDQGLRAGEGETNRSRGEQTGAGAEAAEGIHNADRGRRDEQDNTALANDVDRQADGDPSKRSAPDRRGSEPTTSHPTEHHSSYGGGGEHGGSQ